MLDWFFRLVFVVGGCLGSFPLIYIGQQADHPINPYVIGAAAFGGGWLFSRLVGTVWIWFLSRRDV